MQSDLVPALRRGRHVKLPCPEGSKNSVRSGAAPTDFDRDYWLVHCEGFRVDSAAGRLGFVEDVRAQPSRSRTPILAVRAGALGRRLLLVPAPEVDFIVPRAKRIWLRLPLRFWAPKRVGGGRRENAPPRRDAQLVLIGVVKG